MLRLYESALTSSRRLSRVRASLLYNVALHHITTYLFPSFLPATTPSKWERLILFQRLLEDAPEARFRFCSVSVSLKSYSYGFLAGRSVSAICASTSHHRLVVSEPLPRVCGQR